MRTLKHLTINADFQGGIKATSAEICGETILVYNSCKDSLPRQYWFCVLLFSLPPLVIHIDARDVPGLEGFEGHHQEWRARKLFIAGLAPAFQSIEAMRVWAEVQNMPRMALGRIE